MPIYSMVQKCLLLFCLLFLFFTFTNRANAQCQNIDFTATYKQGCLPTLVRFIAKGAPKGSFYYWDFGKGAIITGGDTILESYTQPGNYTVSLQVRFPDGTTCNIQKGNLLNFSTIAEPAFGTATTNVCSSPAAVTFTDSTANVLRREWYVNGALFADTTKIFTYTFTTSGKHSVALKVFGNNGCSKILAKNNYITVPQQFEINFCSRLEEDADRKKVTAVFKPYIDPSLNAWDIAEYKWDFPGGTPSAYTGLTPPQIIYNDISVARDVSFSVKLKNGCTSTKTKKEFVKRIYKTSINPGQICQMNGVLLNFYLDTLFQPINVYSNKLMNLHRYVQPHAYDFHTIFMETGVADLTFTYNSSQNCTDSFIAKSLFTIVPPNTRFSVTNGRNCSAPQKVFLSAVDKNPAIGINTFTWEIKDTLGNHIGNSPIGPTTNPDTVVIVTKEGFYNVSLKVENSQGCTSINTQSRTIKLFKIVSDARFSKTTMCAGDSISITNNLQPEENNFNSYSHNWFVRHKDSSNIVLFSRLAKPNFFFTKPGIYNVTYTVNTGNCPTTQQFNNAITVNGIVADISAATTKGCAPFATTLSSQIKVNMPAGSALTYNWEVFPAAGAQLTNPNAATTGLTISRNGCYSFKLTISNAAGCSVVVEKTNLICLGTIAAFNSADGVCVGNKLQVTNTSLLNPDIYKWTVIPAAGATISNDTIASPNFTFAADGCYAISLITGKKGVPTCADTVSKIVCVATPSASFYSPDSAKRCAPVEAQFISTSANAHRYFWDFGDGTSVLTSDTSILHTYTQNNPQGYNVKLTAINQFGCFDEYTRQHFIKVYGPVPSFAVDNKKACSSLTVNFTNTSQNVFRSYMDYGDNSGVDTSAQLSSRTYVFRDYTLDSNVFYPTLIALDDSDCVSFYRVPVVVYRPPIAGFNALSKTGCAPFAVKFNNTSLYATRFEWDFDGDGITDDTTENPLYVYQQEGIFKVSLKVTSGKGCTDIISFDSLITVFAKPVASFEPEKTVACFTDTVAFKFTGSTDVPIVSYYWNFDDFDNPNGFSSQQNPKHRFMYPGKHNVTLTIQNQNGCTDFYTYTSGVFINDTTPPQKTSLHYVTVTENNNVELAFKPGNAKEFSRYIIYRDGVADNYLHALEDTTYIDTKNSVAVGSKSFCYRVGVENACGYSAASNAHCTIHLKVSEAASNANHLQWTPYMGWQTVSAYQVYRKQGNNNYLLLATLPHNTLEYTDSNLCPYLYTYYITALHPTENYFSQSNRDTITPNYIYQDVAPEIFYTSVVADAHIYTFWKPGKQPNIKNYVVDRYIKGMGWQHNFHVTTNNFLLDTKTDVNKNNYAYRVKVVDDCGNVSHYSNIGQNILLEGYVQNDKRVLRWNRYNFWADGVLEYKVQLKQNGVFKTVAFNSALDTVYISDSLHAETDTATCYRVIAIESSLSGRQDSSVSNTKCVVLPARIFVPTAFTPNDDGKNDEFKIISLSLINNLEQRKFNFRIFNRWGQVLFETNDVNKGWDGKVNDTFAPVDVYFYVIEAHGYDGSYLVKDGTFKLLR